MDGETERVHPACVIVTGIELHPEDEKVMVADLELQDVLAV